MLPAVRQSRPGLSHLSYQIRTVVAANLEAAPSRVIKRPGLSIHDSLAMREDQQLDAPKTSSEKITSQILLVAASVLSYQDQPGEQPDVGAAELTKAQLMLAPAIGGWQDSLKVLSQITGRAQVAGRFESPVQLVYAVRVLANIGQEYMSHDLAEIAHIT